jgi:hypothetical protein
MFKNPITIIARPALAKYIASTENSLLKTGVSEVCTTPNAMSRDTLSL